MNHKTRGVGVMDLVFIWKLAVLGVHGKIQVCILLLLRVNDDILAILTKQVKIPPPALVRDRSLVHVFVS